MKLIDDCDSILGLHTSLSLVTQTPDRYINTVMPALQEETNAPDEVEIAIIGAGLAGITLAARAWHLGYNQDNMAILDMHGRFAENFVTRTKNINQKIMRSPYKHHLAPMEDVSLSNFARLHHDQLNKDEKKQLKLDRLGERGLPPLDLFLNHTKEVIQSHNLQNAAYQMNVQDMIQQERFWTITSSKGTAIKAKYVILALGNTTNPVELPEDINIPTFSALNTNSERYCNKQVDTVCVIGSGNTAAHVILNAIQHGKRVNWVLRNEQYYRCADIPNEFWRDEGLSQYKKLSVQDRIKKLTDIFHGSAMPEHFYLFRKLQKQGLLRVYEVDQVDQQWTDRSLKLKSGKVIEADIIVFANGIRPVPLPKTSPEVVKYGGFPVLKDESLEAKGPANLYIASTQSALSLGPAAKNIDGMRLANERIFHSILEKENRLDPKLSTIRKLAKWSTTGAITG